MTRLPGGGVPTVDAWNGVALVINFASRSEVDRAVGDAVEIGAVLVERPVE